MRGGYASNSHWRTREDDRFFFLFFKLTTRKCEIWNTVGKTISKIDLGLWGSFESPSNIHLLLKRRTGDTQSTLSLFGPALSIRVVLLVSLLWIPASAIPGTPSRVYENCFRSRVIIQPSLGFVILLGRVRTSTLRPHQSSVQSSPTLFPKVKASERVSCFVHP